jgi:predicted signal transduction protein with EAL and GGDEF domain
MIDSLRSVGVRIALDDFGTVPAAEIPALLGRPLLDTAAA